MVALGKNGTGLFGGSMSTWGYEWWAAYEGERLTLREWLQRVPPDPERLNLEKCAPLFIEEVYLRRSYFVDALGIPKVKHRAEGHRATPGSWRSTFVVAGQIREGLG